ncbi:Prophage CP4-57 regulatory protein (AlpA) [compost metagenome]|uniref:AlpA family phage regulatory protein n=1 Tax=Variovorax boronicumulans TaxID=436515 RepID=UPI000FC0AC28|nr:AlpA family phage regulatory protein [Variovorax boronicumulans]
MSNAASPSPQVQSKAARLSRSERRSALPRVDHTSTPEKTLHCGLGTVSAYASLQQISATPRSIVILRRPQFERRVGLLRSSIYARLDKKSKQYDPSFPRPVSLAAPLNGAHSSGRRRGAVGWIESEVDAWLAQRSSERISTSD